MRIAELSDRIVTADAGPCPARPVTSRRIDTALAEQRRGELLRGPQIDRRRAGLSARQNRAADACAGSVGCTLPRVAGVPFNIVPSSAGIETPSNGSMPVAIS